MDCPFCAHAELEEKEFAPGMPFDVCSQCDGVWLEPGELERLGSKIEGFSYALGRALKSGQATQHACPGCRSLLNRVWIDEARIEPLLCPGCKGSWLSARALHDLRSHRTEATIAPTAPPQEEPVPSRPPVNWIAVAVVAGLAPISFGLFHRAPEPRKSAPPPAPAAPAPEAREAPSEAMLSETEVRAMIRSELRGTVKPAPQRELSSEVDRPAYWLEPDPSRAALVVGVEKYPDLPAADYAARDAKAVRSHLQALGYPDRNILLLTDGDATKGRLTAALNSWLPKHVAEGSTVFFYYSGHGAPDPATRQAYLVPFDADVEDLTDTALPVKQLYAKLGSLNAAHVIVALDACFSGLPGRSVLPKGARPLMTRVDPNASAPEKVTVLSASGADQISGSIAREGHGAFTYFLLRGLNESGAAEGGRVTVASLFKYLKPAVEDAAREQRRDQSPQLVPGASAELVLRRSNRD